MRQVYAHDAVVWMGGADDPAAIGAAVTVALCGHWKHEPPCPLAPHHTRTERRAEQVHVRVLFATDPTVESDVRRRIDQALQTGCQQTPTGETAHWEVMSSKPGTPEEGERQHGERLIIS